MVAEHTAKELDGATLDVLLDETAGLRLVVNRLGAELVSLQRRNPQGKWEGFLYRDDEVSAPQTGWGNHATVMGYFLHRLVNEQSNYRGSVIRGGNHGFLRHFAFDVPEVTSDSLIYKVPVDRVPPDAYPLRVSLNLTYRLDGGSVHVEFCFTNHEPELVAHVSFGLHPGFAVSSVEACRILLPPGTYNRHMAPGNFLDGRVEETSFQGGEMPFSKKDLPGSYLLGLENVPRRIFALEDPVNFHRVELDFSEVPYMTLWSEGSFVCLEPCWGLPDSKPQKPFEHKDGIQIIPPQNILNRSFSITPSFLSQ